VGDPYSSTADSRATRHLAARVRYLAGYFRLPDDRLRILQYADQLDLQATDQDGMQSALLK
jgi:hypothetical protein